MRSIRGLDQARNHLWEALEVYDADGHSFWISSGHGITTLVRHIPLEDVITFWMEGVPFTDKVETSWGKETYPTKVITWKIAALVYQAVRDE